jgi:C-terminal processing protease CtpA/Prc
MLTAIFVMVDRLKDSHTAFIPPRRVGRAIFGFEAKPFGDEILIYKVKKDRPAAAAGLEKGDRVLAINGYRLDRSMFDPFTLYCRVLRPVPVMEIVFSRGNDPPRTVRVEGKIKEGSVYTDLTNLNNVWPLMREAEADQEEEHPESEQREDGVGYLCLPSFTADRDRVWSVVGHIAHARAVVIDLRDNLGGHEDFLKFFMGFFEPERTLVGRKVGRKKEEDFEVKPQHPSLAVPLFILVDSRSSSAAEIFARHFQRTGRAKVVGDKSSGRVTGSRIFSEHVGADIAVIFAVQVAVERLVFPRGEELEKRGVTPDHACIPSGDDLRKDRDPCKDVALDLARKAISTAK